MKKLFILYSSLLISICISAQNTTAKNNPGDNFCSMLNKIVFSATSNFTQNCNFIKKEDIYIERGLYTLTGYKTDLILPGTLYCLIDFKSDLSNSKVFNSTTDPAYYFSRIEGFNTETTAIKRIEQIKNELAACLVNYNVEKTQPNYAYISIFSEIPLNYVFTQKKQTNQSAPKFILQVESHNSDFFTINLIVPGTGKQTIPKNPETAVLPKEPTQLKLAKQLLELLDYAKNRFKTIKGEPNEAMNEKNKYSGAMYFKTSIELKEAVENYIEETNSKIKFKADFGKNLTKTGGKELFKDLSKKIKEETWDDFEIKEYSGYIFGDYLRVRRKNDYTHSILLTFDDGEYNESSPKVYITVE